MYMQLVHTHFKAIWSEFMYFDDLYMFRRNCTEDTMDLSASYSEEIMWTNTLFSVSTIISYIHYLYWLQLHPTVGPVVISASQVTNEFRWSHSAAGRMRFPAVRVLQIGGGQSYVDFYVVFVRVGNGAFYYWLNCVEKRRYMTIGHWPKKCCTLVFHIRPIDFFQHLFRFKNHFKR